MSSTKTGASVSAGDRCNVSCELSCSIRGNVIAVLVEEEGALEFFREWFILIGSVSLIQHATMMARNTGNTPNKNGTPLKSSFCLCGT